jgi:hypothetical protein
MAMFIRHGKAEVLEEDLCSARDVFRVAQEYADPLPPRLTPADQA